MKIIRRKLLHLFQREPRTFSLLVKPLGVLSKSLPFLAICVNLVTVLTPQSSRLGMRGPIIRRKSQQISHEGKFNGLLASLKLNSSCFLSMKRISDCLHHSVPLNCLNLCPTSSEAQSTQYLPTQSGDLEHFSCNDDLSYDIPNFDLGILKRNPSPNSNDFLADLSREFKINNVD